MRLSGYSLYMLCTLVLVFTGQAMAGEWIDEFDDEEQMAEVWTPLFGNWVFMDGIYRMEMGPGCGAAITDFEVSDGTTIEIKAQYVDGGWENYSIIFAYMSDEEAYQVDIRGGGEIVKVEKFTPGTETVQSLAQGNQVADRNVWYTLTVVIDGDTVIGFVDEKEIVRYTFPQGLPEGKIGLGGQQSNTEFEYMTITGPRIGLAVSHIGKLAATWAGIKAQD